MHHSEQKIAHISVVNGALWHIGQVFCGICEIIIALVNHLRKVLQIWYIVFICFGNVSFVTQMWSFDGWNIFPLWHSWHFLLTTFYLHWKEHLSQEMINSQQCILFCLHGKIDGMFSSSSPRQNGCHFADDIFKCIFVNEKFRILIKLLLKFVPTGPIDNNPALV